MSESRVIAYFSHLTEEIYPARESYSMKDPKTNNHQLYDFVNSIDNHGRHREDRQEDNRSLFTHLFSLSSCWEVDFSWSALLITPIVSFQLGIEISGSIRRNI